MKKFIIIGVLLLAASAWAAGTIMMRHGTEAEVYASAALGTTVTEDYTSTINLATGSDWYVGTVIEVYYTEDGNNASDNLGVSVFALPPNGNFSDAVSTGITKHPIYSVELDKGGLAATGATAYITIEGFPKLVVGASSVVAADNYTVRIRHTPYNYYYN